MELPNELHTMTGDRSERECACDEINGRCDCRRGVSRGKKKRA